MRTLRNSTSAVLGLAALVAISILSGCGTSSTDTASLSPSSPTPAQHASAAGVAVNAELTMDQIAFDSAVKHVKDKNGLEFLHFNYTDTDGKVYKCNLPAAMTEGKRTPSQWLALFDAYKVPEAVATKKTVTTRSEHLGDFPFISPKPVRPAPEAKTTEAPAPQNIPAPPPLPSSPSVGGSQSMPPPMPAGGPSGPPMVPSPMVRPGPQPPSGPRG